jgi:putative FmdB family regulatory protein
MALMPSYEFVCKACNKKFSVIMTLAEYEKGNFSCPKCKSKKVEQKYAAFYAVTSKKS